MLFVDQRENLPGATRGPVQRGRLMGLGAVPSRMPQGLLMAVQSEEGVTWGHSEFDEHTWGHRYPRDRQGTFKESTEARRGNFSSQPGPGVLL